MSDRYSHVLSPIRLGRTYFRNRIFASPVSLPDYSNVACMTDRQKEFYATRARGGAASVSTGDGTVDSETGNLHPYKLRLDDPAIFPALTDMTRKIRQYGAVPTCELSHGGKYANVANLIGDMHSKKKAYGPNHEFTANGEEIFEMTPEMIEEIAERYGRAAARAKEAEFGMVLIHGGHGWLLNQFMSPATNHRTDEFGGSFENRMRFTLMVIDRVRKAVGPGFPIEFRMSGAEFTEGGYGIEYGIRIAKAIDGLVDLIHVSAGVHDNVDTFIITHPSMFLEHGCNVWLAEQIKKEVKTPVATIGALTDPDMLEEIIASGKADVVEMGRQLMADPYFPRKMQEGREAEITHCIRCFTCMEQLRHGRSMRCALNPQVGREDDPPAAKAEEEKLVLVAGGGPAGMEAALAARERGHKVILFEASDMLGGELKYERYLPFKKDMYRFAESQAAKMERAGVEVRLNTPLTPELAASLHPDGIIAAMGAEPVRIPIPGIDGGNVVDCRILKDPDPAIGKSVCVLGGGLVGCESAVHFAMEGKKVTIVEMLSDVARDATWPHRLALMKALKENGVEIVCSARATEITGEGLKYTNSNGEECFVPAETIFLSVGMRAKQDQAEALRNIAPRFEIVGDCRQPGQLFYAVTGGRYAGREI